MNNENTQAPAAIQDPPARPQRLIVQDNSPIAYLMDTAKMLQVERIADRMAMSNLIPDHLRLVKIDGKYEWLTIEQIKGNCFLICNQALRWGIDPFALAPETYVVSGKLAYQGKLVAAIINASSALESRLTHEFTGKPGNDDFTITVTGRFRGENFDRSVTASVGQHKTDNKIWKVDPEQKLVYTGTIKWARRYCPEIILGIRIDDEDPIEPMRDANPPRKSTLLDDGAPRIEAQVTGKDSPAAAGVGAPAAEPTRRGRPPKETTPPPAVEAPDRATMMGDLAAACQALGVTQKIGGLCYRSAGVVPADKMISELTDEEVFPVWQVRESAIVQFRHLHEVSANPAGVTPAAEPELPMP